MSVTTDIRRGSAVLENTLGALPRPGGEVVTEVIVVEEICPPSAVYTPDASPYLILFLTLQGRSRLTAGTQALLHEAGTLIMTAAGCSIREEVQYGQPWHLCYVLLRGIWADQMSAHLQANPSGPAVAFPRATAQRRQLFADIFEMVLSQPDGWEWRLLSRTAELLGDLFREALLTQADKTVLPKIAALIEADPAARPTLAQLAAQVGLTPRQLLYQFQKVAGEPLALWIRKRRILSAQRLLGQGLSVRMVAEQLGFANPYHFSRCFKAITGNPPSIVSENARRTGLHLHSDQADRQRDCIP